MVKWEDGAGPLDVMKIWGGSSNARPFENEDFPHIPAKSFFGGEAIAPLPPVPTPLQWCRCLVVGRSEGK